MYVSVCVYMALCVRCDFILMNQSVYVQFMRVCIISMYVRVTKTSLDKLIIQTLHLLHRLPQVSCTGRGAPTRT